MDDDEQRGNWSTRFRRGAGMNFKHEELALPDEIPNWLTTATKDGRRGKRGRNASDAFREAGWTPASRLHCLLRCRTVHAQKTLRLSANLSGNLDRSMVADWGLITTGQQLHIHLMMTLHR